MKTCIFVHFCHCQHKACYINLAWKHEFVAHLLILSPTVYRLRFTYKSDLWCLTQLNNWDILTILLVPPVCQRSLHVVLLFYCFRDFWMFTHLPSLTLSYWNDFYWTKFNLLETQILNQKWRFHILHTKKNLIILMRKFLKKKKIIHMIGLTRIFKGFLTSICNMNCGVLKCSIYRKCIADVS
jgi:hypothetical protein